MGFSAFRDTIVKGDFIMRRNHFMQGVGLGMLAGAVVGMLVSPGKKELKRTAVKAARAVENAAENISDAIEG